MSEFSRPVPFERPPAEATVRATAEECAALAARLGIEAVESLECRFRLRPEGRAVLAETALAAEVVQLCVVSLEPVRQRVDEAVRLRFVPAGDETDDMAPESPDEIPVQGSTIDLGEAASEQLALALDPYPRLPDAEMEEDAADAAASPFAILRPKA